MANKVASGSVGSWECALMGQDFKLLNADWTFNLDTMSVRTRVRERCSGYHLVRV